MYFRILLVTLVLTSLIACEFQVGENTATKDHSQRYKCVDAEKLKQGGIVGARLDALLKSKDYFCVEQLLSAGTFIAPDKHAVSTLLEFLMPNVSAASPSPSSLPNATNLAALSYLNVHAEFAKKQGFRLEQFGDFIRAETKNSTGKTQAEAYSLLLNIVQDNDIPLIVEGMKSGSDESLVALGTFSLAGSCSSAAIAALRETLKHPNVIAYLQKYKDKEDIHKVLQQRCPAALNSR